MKNSQNQNFRFFGQPMSEIRVIEHRPKRVDLGRPVDSQIAVSQLLLHVETKVIYQIKALEKLYLSRAFRNESF